MTFRCCICKKEYDITQIGGNEYWDKYCKKCWQSFKKIIGKSWGGSRDDKEDNTD